MMWLTHIKILMIFLFKMTRLMHYTQLAQFSCFENDATITYPNRHESLVLKITPLSHTQIGANFLFWKWRHFYMHKSARISCFENDTTTAYPNQRKYPVLKMTPLPHTWIGANFLFWKWRHYPHTQIGANFLFWKWRQYLLHKPTQISMLGKFFVCDFPILNFTPKYALMLICCNICSISIAIGQVSLLHFYVLLNKMLDESSMFWC